MGTVALASFFALLAAPLALAEALNLPCFISARQRLARTKLKHLAYAIPFGPVATLWVFRVGHQRLPFSIPLLGLGLSIVLTTCFSTAFAACWLCLSNAPGRHVQTGRALMLSYVFWLFDSFAMRAVLGTI
jgi:hypothetical protein